MQVASLQRTGGLIAALLAVIALFLGATYVGGSAMSALQQGFQENVTFTKKDFVPYSERRRWVPPRFNSLGTKDRRITQCREQ